MPNSCGVLVSLSVLAGIVLGLQLGHSPSPSAATSPLQPNSTARSIPGALVQPDGNNTGGGVHFDLGQLKLVVDSDYYQRAIAVLGDSGAVAAALARARSTGRLRYVVLGGSVAGGRASKQCCKKLDVKRARSQYVSGCCGPSYSEWIRKWLSEDLGLQVEAINLSVRGSGPETAALCIAEWLHNHKAEEIDLVLMDYSVNADAATCVPTLELLLARLGRVVPHAGLMFVNTFRYLDATDQSHCINTLSRFHGIPAVSLRDAVWPRIARGLDTLRVLFEQPDLSHPSAYGHKVTASIVAHTLLHLELRSRAANGLQSNGASHLPLRTLPARPIKGIDVALHERISRSPPPKCILGVASITANTTANTGWTVEPKRRSTYASNTRGAELILHFVCEYAGCGLFAVLVMSYQPLGMLDVLVDGRVVLNGSSEANPEWRQRGRKVTVLHNVIVVQPASSGGSADTQTGLQKGAHTMTFRARGESALAVKGWWSNYTEHEVRVAGLVVIYNAQDALLSAG